MAKGVFAFLKVNNKFFTFGRIQLHQIAWRPLNHVIDSMLSVAVFSLWNNLSNSSIIHVFPSRDAWGPQVVNHEFRRHMMILVTKCDVVINRKPKENSDTPFSSFSHVYVQYKLQDNIKLHSVPFFIFISTRWKWTLIDTLSSHGNIKGEIISF